MQANSSTVSLDSSSDYPPEDAREKYEGQRRNAAKRQIPWLIDFDAWMALWLASGKWEQRGRKRGQYVMARARDVGPYSVENVRIVTNADNARERHQTSPMAYANLGKGRGWKLDRRSTGPRPYEARFRDKSLGSFATAEEARAAYLLAVERDKALRG